MKDDEPAELEWAKASLVLSLRQKGITQRQIVDAFERLPHELFVPDEFAAHAYKDCALPIDCGQSMTSPVKVAQMLSKLNFDEPVSKILEIGTGSGYATALLSRFAKRVFTIEKYGTLLRQAQARWEQLNISNIVSQHGDGLAGWPLQEPFDRIVLTGSVKQVMPELMDQLADGGYLLAPIGAPNELQQLVRYERLGTQFAEDVVGSIRLAPLMHGKSQTL
ncbi:protein-L-isoaspartate(D-aspartate) O-methyltransferase [Maritalea mediterranea]|uniref:Protein-L-isoaspartate O-methyltransferase n=1 Tax=Maritalea mediterranea TaxID=2909667 RepID=A0ABS9E605_9HYPH|nr:protein-L-isoaspartate(D-aspartate) O-methyltransferase [Maritalea mediterranea]MCF4098286.1 protein-L-isoaspartate(D-aspartate) O-methyltransferase [Maritalea mediterranea]